MKMLELTTAWDDIATMLWLDMRATVNTFGRINREPMRMAGWVFWIAFFVWKLVLQPHGIAVPAEQHNSPVVDLSAAMLLLVAGISLVRGETSGIAFFTTPLEARWMSGSHLRPWVTITYLQIRNIVERLPSFALFLAFMLSYMLPPMHSPLQFACGVINVVMITFCTRMLSVPRELAPAYLEKPLVGLGVIILAAGGIAGFESLANLLDIPKTVPTFFPVLHFGQVYVAGAHGDLGVMLATGSILAICIVSLVMLSRDRYPELYELSRSAWELRSRFKEGRLHLLGDEGKHDLSDAALRKIPSGAAVLLWTNWQMFCRHNMKNWPFIRPMLAVAFGLFVGSLHVEPHKLVGLLGIAFCMTTTFSSLIDAVRVGATIRHPIFWLTKTTFTARLAMTLFSWYWRSAFDVMMFGVGLVIVGSDPRMTMLAITVAIVVVWLQRCIGLISFAMLPSRSDLGGPLLVVRFMISLLMIMPPIFCGVYLGARAQDAGLGFVVALGIALVEGVILIFSAAKLLDGRFDRILGS